jgi:hypothetical protein
MEVTVCSALGVAGVDLPLMARRDSLGHYFVCSSGYHVRLESALRFVPLFVRPDTLSASLS